MTNENPKDPSIDNSSTAPVPPASAAQAAPSAPAAQAAPSVPATGKASRKASPVHPDAAPQAAKAEVYGGVVAAQNADRKKNAPFIIAVLLLALLIVTSMGSCVAGSAKETGSISLGDKVAVIELGGVIQYDDSACSPEGFKILLDQAEQDPSIKALVLRVDSGGGVATAGEEMTDLLNDFSKPVVVSTASINASAAYEISSQADYIFAARTSQVGSIGTVMSLTDYSGLYDMLGIQTENISSADSKDSSYGNRALTDDERAHYQQMVDETNDVFISFVAEGRGVSEETVRGWATGMTWTGMTAKDMGLIDEVGTVDDAFEKAAELGGCSGSYEQVELYLETSNFGGILELL